MHCYYAKKGHDTTRHRIDVLLAAATAPIQQQQQCTILKYPSAAAHLAYRCSRVASCRFVLCRFVLTSTWRYISMATERPTDRLTKRTNVSCLVLLKKKIPNYSTQTTTTTTTFYKDNSNSSSSNMNTHTHGRTGGRTRSIIIIITLHTVCV